MPAATSNDAPLEPVEPVEPLDSETPWTPKASPSSDRDAQFQYKWAVTIGVLGGLAHASTAGILWGLRWPAVRSEARRANRSNDECVDDVDGGCNSFDLNLAPGGVVLRTGFMAWPFFPATAGMAMSMLSGHLLGKSRPRPIHPKRLFAAGGATVGVGTIAFLVGRLRRPSCFEGGCIDRWFHTNALLYTLGAVAVGMGGAMITYGKASQRTLVQPQVALGRDGAQLGLSVRF